MQNEMYAGLVAAVEFTCTPPVLLHSAASSPGDLKLPHAHTHWGKTLSLEGSSTRLLEDSLSGRQQSLCILF